MRPIVNAMDGPKKTASDIYSDVLSAVVDSRNYGTLCSSTEELLEAFESYNKSNNLSKNKEERVVGSMDAVSLYPSLEANRSAEIIIEEVIRSEVNFENIDSHELGIYLRKNLSSEYIEEKGYSKFLPRKVLDGKSNYDNDENENYNVDEFLEDMENMFNDIDFMSHDEYIETIIDSTSTMGEDTNETSGVNEENDTASSMGKAPDATSSTGGEDNKASNEVETFESKNEEKREKNPSKKKNKSYWEAAETDLDDNNRKILVAEALGILCKVVMNNHVYSFNGKIMLQTGKGCIGDEAIGVIAWLVMIWWS